MNGGNKESWVIVGSKELWRSLKLLAIKPKSLILNIRSLGRPSKMIILKDS